MYFIYILTSLACWLYTLIPAPLPQPEHYLLFNGLIAQSISTEESVQSIWERGKKGQIYRSSKITVSCGHNLSSCRVNLESSEVS
jgi:hypothetical protein